MKGFIIWVLILPTMFSAESVSNEHIKSKKVKNLNFIFLKSNNLISDDNNTHLATTLIEDLQNSVSNYIKSKKEPISAVALVDVATGKLLVLAEGRNPKDWGANIPTFVFPGFPAASLFKSITTLAAFDAIGLKPGRFMPLLGGCSKVGARGIWLRSIKKQKKYRMNIERAFAFSCNSFYAKLSVQYVGLELISLYARRFGWGDKKIPADFDIPKSPIHFPTAVSSNIQTVGKFAAGFGLVGASVAHMAWMNLVIASKGLNRDIRLFNHHKIQNFQERKSEEKLIKEKTAEKFLEISRKTVRYGTAHSSFYKRRYRRIRNKVGGKTGTLSTRAPAGQITWFAGFMPYKQPKVVVVTMVLNDQKIWHMRASDLAAETIRLWDIWSRNKNTLKLSSKDKSDNKIIK